MNEAEREAVKQGQAATNTKTSNKVPAPDKLVLRTPDQIQKATKIELEALSDVASDQFIAALETRTIEKLAYKILDRSDVIAKGASDKVLDFLPKLLNANALMEEESELDQFMALTEAA